MGGIDLILIVFADPPTVRLLTVITPPPFNTGMFSVESLMLNVPIGNAKEPAVFVIVRVLLEIIAMALTPPPETMVLASTLPPLRLSVPVTVADPPLVRASRNRVGT